MPCSQLRQVIENASIRDMRDRLTCDEIDKIVDALLNRLNFSVVSVSRELTYVSMPVIADRLGCSVKTVERLWKRGLLRCFYRYRGRRRYLCTNETLIRESMVAWTDAARILCQAESKLREGKAEPPASGTAR